MIIMAVPIGVIPGWIAAPRCALQFLDPLLDLPAVAPRLRGRLLQGLQVLLLSAAFRSGAVDAVGPSGGAPGASALGGLARGCLGLHPLQLFHPLLDLPAVAPRLRSGILQRLQMLPLGCPLVPARLVLSGRAGGGISTVAPRQARRADAGSALGPCLEHGGELPVAVELSSEVTRRPSLHSQHSIRWLLWSTAWRLACICQKSIERITQLALCKCAASWKTCSNGVDCVLRQQLVNTGPLFWGLSQHPCYKVTGLLTVQLWQRFWLSPHDLHAQRCNVVPLERRLQGKQLIQHHT
mmetsp:Transcript_149735/g.417344  ORF Transcript_149735/g.417344 Transcript_149735/m.417344 type:complete len:296 (+) Transcript_149735:1370-2257(+)